MVPLVAEIYNWLVVG